MSRDEPRSRCCTISGDGVRKDLVVIERGMTASPELLVNLTAILLYFSFGTFRFALSFYYRW
jgi:hypothetical protein